MPNTTDKFSVSEVEVCPKCHHYKWRGEDCPFCAHLEAEIEAGAQAAAEDAIWAAARATWTAVQAIWKKEEAGKDYGRTNGG